MFFFELLEENDIKPEVHKKSEKIRAFRIYNLFGEYDVFLEFNNSDSIELYIGMNGIGKTTILNMLYHTLEGDFLKLREYTFDSLEIFTIKNRRLFLNRESLFEIKNLRISLAFINDFKKILSEEEQKKLEYVISKNDFLETEVFFRSISERNKISPKFQRYIDKIMLEGDSNAKKLKNVRNFLLSLNLPKILYFPTYRRIEDDANKLGVNIANQIGKDGLINSSNLIKFGMDDVQEKINEFRSQIKIRTLRSYQSITQNLLNYLILEDLEFKKIENFSDYELMERIVKRLDNEILFDLDLLKKSINQNKETSEKDTILLFLLNKLIESYKEYEWIDEALENFCGACNKYLKGKKFDYEKHTIDLSVKSEFDNREIPLNYLSSGEKQIVSLFAKLYLTKQTKFIILFDEPELSLSLEWQERLIKDIKASGKIEFLVGVTHSPFIISEEFEGNANSIELFINPASNPGGILK